MNNKLACSLFLRIKIALLLLIPLMYCSFDPPTAPKWETTLTLPLINKTFQMDEIVEDEKYLQADSSGQVYFDFSKDIDRYSVGDKLQIDGLEESFESDVGSFNIEAPEPKTLGFGFNEIYSEAELLHGNTVIVPDFVIPDVVSAIPVFDEFSWIVIDTGNVYLNLTNNLPVWLGSGLVFRLIESSADTLISEISFDQEIAPGENVKTSINVSGKRFSNQLELLLSGNSPGSKGESVQIDAYSSIDVVTSYSDFTVKEAVGKTPAIRMSQMQTIAIEDSIIINEATIQSGNLNFDIDNQLPIPAKIIYELTDFFQNDKPYTDSLFIYARSHSQISLPLQNITLRPEYAQVGEQKIKFEWTFVTESSDELVHLRNSDQVQAQMSSSEIVFSEISGVLNEIKIDIEPFAEDLNFSDELDSVKLENAVIRLDIENTINLPAKSDIVIRGINDAGKTVDLLVQEDIFAAPEDGSKITTIVLDKNNSNVVKFLNALPKQIEMSGSVKLGDKNSQGTVTQSDYIEGKMNISAPLSLSFPTQSATTDIDTLEIEEENRETIRDRLMSGEVVARITNKLPFGAIIQAKFGTQDSTVFSNPELVIGPLDIKPAMVDESGYTSDVSENELKVTLTKEDLRLFENSMVFTGVEIIFPGSDGNAVHVVTSDYIKVQMYSVFKIAVDADDDK